MNLLISVIGYREVAESVAKVAKKQPSGRFVKVIEQASPKEFLEKRNSPKQQKICLALVEGKEKDEKGRPLKPQLMQVAPCCKPSGEDNLLVNAEPNGVYVVDIDRPKGQTPEEKAEWQSKVKDRVLANKYGLRCFFFYETARGGYHLWCEMLPDLSQAECLLRAQAILGIEVDPHVKDHTRVLFQTTNDHIIYIDVERFIDCVDLPWPEPENPVPTWKEKEPELLQEEEESEAEEEVSEADRSRVLTMSCQPKFTEAGIAGLSISQFLHRYWERFTGGLPPEEGERNEELYKLAKTIAPACDYDEKRMQKIVPNLFQNEGAEGTKEWKQIIRSACKERTAGVSARLMNLLEDARLLGVLKACGGTYQTPPPMPKKLPRIIRLLLENTPPPYQAAVANAVFAGLGANLHDVRFKYADNKQHEAHILSMLIGPMSGGKSCIEGPCRELKALMKIHDRQAEAQLTEWAKQKAENPTAQIARPNVCRRLVSPDFTSASFHQYVIDAHKAGKYYMYITENEVENLLTLGKRNKNWNDLFELLRNAYDNKVIGQQRVSADAVNGSAPLRLNLNVATVYGTAMRQFGGVQQLNGTLSRIDIQCIDECYELPIYGEYTAEWRQELRSYLCLLDQAHGLIECPKATQLVKTLIEAHRKNFEETGSIAYWIYMKRQLVISWLKGMILFICNNYQWDKTISDFVEWSCRYGLWCKLRFFGEEMEALKRKEMRLTGKGTNVRRSQVSLLDYLPQEFTKEEYKAVRKEHPELCSDKGNAMALLRTWKKRGSIEFDDIAGKFIKKQR